MKHLVKDFNIDLDAIKAFNTRKVLSNRNFTYLKNTKKENTPKNKTNNKTNNKSENTTNNKSNNKTNNKTRKNRKN